MNEELGYWIDPRDKPGLLLAMMRAFVSNSHESYISFEGGLDNLNFSTLPGAACAEIEKILQRQTISQLDFIVIPLTEQNLREIWKELIAKDHLVREGIIHVQIRYCGKLVFGGYDNFHRECVFADSSVPIELLEKLKANGVIRKYTKSKIRQ